MPKLYIINLCLPIYQTVLKYIILYRYKNLEPSLSISIIIPSTIMDQIHCKNMHTQNIIVFVIEDQDTAL